MGVSEGVGHQPPSVGVMRLRATRPYIHKEAELYEANNRARRAWNEHREKVHEGMAFA